MSNPLYDSRNPNHGRSGGLRTRNTRHPNRWEASIDREPVGRAQRKEGAWNIAISKLNDQSKGEL